MRRGRLLVPLCVHTAVLVVCAFCAYWTMFSSYKSYDDEGYHVWSLRLFANGHALYNDVFSSYGPFPYELWAGISKLTGATVSTNNGRLATMALWLGTSVLLAVTTRRLTGSLTLAVVVQVLSFSERDFIRHKHFLIGLHLQHLVVNDDAVEIKENCFNHEKV